MKIYKFYFLSLLFLMGLISCGNNEKEKASIKSETINNSDKEVENFIKEFYTAYISESEKSISPKQLQEQLDSITQIYCTKSLLDSISNEFENNELDYDPFLNAQDSNMEMLKTLLINKSEKRGTSYEVMFLSDKYDSSFEKVVLKVSKFNGKYKISSIK